MLRLSPTWRLTIGLVSLSVTVLLAAETIGVIPNAQRSARRGRTALCEAIAVNLSLDASRNDIPRMKASLEAIVERNEEIQSAGIRRRDGRLLVEVGDHVAHWTTAANADSVDSHAYVPILAGSREWGRVEIRFQPLETTGWLSIFHRPLVRLGLFVTALSFALFSLFLSHMLSQLDPSQAVPERVREALDTLAEGLIVVNKDERIVLANRAFAETIGCAPAELQGRRASKLAWSKPQDQAELVLPWQHSLAEGSTRTGVMLDLATANSERRTFKVNAAPVIGAKGRYCGAMASFDDVTLIERNRIELRQMIHELRQSRDEIRRQNQDLEILATRDALTSCLNRRSLFVAFESQWKTAQQHDRPLSCIMVDVDHFKSINDTHGHQRGDDVLRKLSETLRSSARGADIVGRYGGEEFCIVLPNTDLDAAFNVAESLRQAIESADFAGLKVTASLGVSARHLGAKNPQELLDQADKCLYLAKRNGRNQSIRWDQIPEGEEIEQPTGRPAAREDTLDVSIPFHAVTALISALAYRDSSTAEHSRRVADLCVNAAHGRMSVTECYTLEIAALLHDIGKIGVPDAILLKPGPLTEDEWKVMTTHDNMGVEIIRAAFNSPTLSEIVEHHHAWFGGNPREPDLPTGLSIPLGARILTMADAYDAMVSDRVYRKGRDREAAFAELRRCAGRQFDPNLVEAFIESVQSRDDSRYAAEGSVSKQTALRIGVQIERIATLIDQQDLAGLRGMAAHLKATARKCGVTRIADLAEELERVADDERELVEIVNVTNELLALCRATQRAYLTNESGRG